MGRKLYAKGEGFNPSTSIEDVEGLREELDALAGSGGGGGDNPAIERRLSTAEGEIDDLQQEVAQQSSILNQVSGEVSTLRGSDKGKSVRAIAAEETAKIVGNAPANYDTLKEIADYIATDATGAAELSNKVNKNATDIAKVAEDLSATHQLASNAESAISEVVELTIPAIESDVANKATKTEAQGYATTAKSEAIAAAATDAQNKANTAESNANDYTDGEVEKLATVAPIAAGKIVKLTFGWTVSTLISFNATQGAAKDLFYYATHGTGTSVRTQYNFLHQSGLLKIYIDESNTGNVLYLHNTTQAGTMSVNNLIPSTVSIEEISAIPENATLIGDEKTLATLPDVRTRLGKTEQAADSAKLAGIPLVVKWDGANRGIPYLSSTGIMEFGRIIDFHIASEPSGTDYATRLRCQETVTGVQVYLPSTSGTLALKTDNVASATKLSTPRKLWGQSFDGTGNIDGDMEVNGDVVIKGNVVIEGNITSGASYQSNPLSTISEGEVPSVEQQLRSQISSLEERIATLEQLIAQNNG